MADFNSNRVVCSKSLIKYLVRRDESTNFSDKVDFNILIPMPSDLDIECSSNIFDCILAYLKIVSPYCEKFDSFDKLDKITFDRLYKLFLEKSNLPNFDLKSCVIDFNLYSKGKRYVENLIKYDSYTWFSWSIKNWGCKWNADTISVQEIGVDKVEINFLTPYNAPYGIMEKFFEIGKEKVEWYSHYDYDNEPVRYYYEDNQIKFIYESQIQLEELDFDNKYSIIDAIKHNPELYFSLPYEIQQDKEIMLVAINSQYRFYEKNYDWYYHLSDNLKNDIEIISDIIINNPDRVDLISKIENADKDIFLKLAKKTSLYSNFPDKFKNDINIIETAISANIEIFNELSDNLKNDKRIIQIFVSNLSVWKIDKLSNYSLKISSRDEMKELLNLNGCAIFLGTDELKNDESLIKLSVSKEPYIYQYLDEKFKKNYDIMLIASKKNSYAMCQYFDGVINDKKAILSIIDDEPDVLAYASNQLKDDIELAEHALKKDIYTLKYLSDRLRNDKKIINIVMNTESYHKPYYYFGNTILNDREFILSIDDYSIIDYVPVKFKSDKEFVGKMIDLDEKNISKIDLKLFYDVDFIIDKIKNNLNLLEFFPIQIKNDKKLINQLIDKLISFYNYDFNDISQKNRFFISLLKNNKNTFILECYPEILNNELFLEEAIKVNSNIYAYLPQKYKNDYHLTYIALYIAYHNYEIDNIINFVDKKILYDKNFALSLVDISPCFIEYLSDELRNDVDIVYKVGSKSPYYLRYAGKIALSNVDLIKKMIKKNYNSYLYIDSSLKNDVSLALMAVNAGFSNYSFLSDSLKTNEKIINSYLLNSISFEDGFENVIKINDKEIAKDLISKNWNVIRLCSDELKNDRDIALIAIEKDGRALEFLSDNLKNNKELVKLAVSKNGYTIQYSSENIRNDEEIAKLAINTDRYAEDYVGDELKNSDALKDIVSDKNDKNIAWDIIFNGGIYGNYCNEEVKNACKGCYTKQEHYDRALELVSSPVSSSDRFLLAYIYEIYGASFRQEAIKSVIDYLNNEPYKRAVLFDSELSESDNDYNKKYPLALKYHIGRWYRILGQLYMKEKLYNESIEAFDKSIEINPYYHGSYIDKAECLNKMNKDKSGYLYLLDIQKSELYSKFPRGIFYEKGADFKKKIDRAVKKPK
ncbi:MAG: DUF4116 domain-containing protein [Bacilli bacterium]|nr:DUF4116 domain-containing protein [Bacilli bacterium]